MNEDRPYFFWYAVAEGYRFEAGFAAYWGNRYAKYDDDTELAKLGQPTMRETYVWGAAMDRSRSDIHARAAGRLAR